MAMSQRARRLPWRHIEVYFRRTFAASDSLLKTCSDQWLFSAAFLLLFLASLIFNPVDVGRIIGGMGELSTNQ